MQALNGLSAAVVIFLFFLGVLWALLPFAVFGIKDLAKTLIAEQRKTNELLARLAGVSEMKTRGAPPYEPTNLYGTGPVPAGDGSTGKTNP